jgi:hypothetical protein
MQEKLMEFLNGQEWFQQLKQKWDELDAQSRMYLQISAAVGTVGLVLFMLFNFIWKVHKLRDEVTEKSELLTSITNANDELKHLREVNAPLLAASGVTPGAAPGTPAGDAAPEPKTDPWPVYIESAAGRVGLDKSTCSVGDPKPGNSNDTTKESLIDVSLKKVNIKQIVRFALGVQNGGRPVKLRNLTIDTLPDGSGYLNATLSLSAFNLVQNK